MKAHPQHFMDMPVVYRIQIHGRMDPSWIEAVWGGAFEIDEPVETPDETVFISKMCDQAALVGCINALYNLGHAIISITAVESEERERLEKHGR
jgi:hypothetical protein